MPFYELTGEQQKILMNILANAQIRGQDAPVIVQLAQALQKPIDINKLKENGTKST